MYVDIIFNRHGEHLRVTFMTFSDSEASGVEHGFIVLPDISDKNWTVDTEEFGKSICQECCVKHTAQDFKHIILEIKTPIAREAIKRKYEEFFEEKYPAYMSQF